MGLLPCGRPQPGAVLVGEPERARPPGNPPSFTPAGARDPHPPALLSSIPPNPGPSPQPRPPSGSSTPTQTGVPWLRGSAFSGLSLLTCSTYVKAATVRGPEEPHKGSGRGGLLGEPGRTGEATVSGVRRIWGHTAAHSLKTFPERNLWAEPSDSAVTKTRPGSEVLSAAGPA